MCGKLSNWQANDVKSSYKLVGQVIRLTCFPESMLLRKGKYLRIGKKFSGNDNGFIEKNSSSLFTMVAHFWSSYSFLQEKKCVVLLKTKQNTVKQLNLSSHK